MKRTDIYCITTPKEAKRLFELAEKNGIDVFETCNNYETAILIANDGIMTAEFWQESDVEDIDKDLTKITPHEMEAVITSVPVYLTTEDWNKFFEQILFTNPDATRIAKAIQSQLKQ